MWGGDIVNMPKNKEDFERKMLWAFHCGMNAGYGVEHTNIHEDEDREIREFAERYGFKIKSRD